ARGSRVPFSRGCVLMARTIDVNDELSQKLLAGAAKVPLAKPRAYYDEDGDCIEFLFSDESYYAERMDCLLTVYYGRDSREVVGSLIKGVRRFIGEVREHAPGFKVEFRDGKVRLKHIFTAGLWKRGDREPD